MLLLLIFSNYFLTLSQSCVLLFGVYYKETFPVLQEKSEHASYMCMWGYISMQCSGDSYAVLPFEQEIISISFF